MAKKKQPRQRRPAKKKPNADRIQRLRPAAGGGGGGRADDRRASGVMDPMRRLAWDLVVVGLTVAVVAPLTLSTLAADAARAHDDVAAPALHRGEPG
jgi:hypothetical protein